LPAKTSSSSWPISPTTAAICATESQVANMPKPSGDMARAASENIANASAPLPTFSRMVPATPRVTSRRISWRMESIMRRTGQLAARDGMDDSGGEGSTRPGLEC